MSDEEKDEGEFISFAADREGIRLANGPDDEVLNRIASEAMAAGQSPEDIQRLLQATATEHGMNVIPIVATSVDEALAIYHEMALLKRHPATQGLVGWFDYDHLKPGLGKETSKILREVAMAMVSTLNDGPELTTGLRKLLEAKDCFVRQAIQTQREDKAEETNPLLSVLGDMLTRLREDTAERRVDDVDLPGDPAPSGETPVAPTTTSKETDPA